MPITKKMIQAHYQSGADRAKPWHRQLALGVFFVALLSSILPTGLSWDFSAAVDMVEGSWVRRLQWSVPIALAFWLLIQVKSQTKFLFFWLNPFVFILMAYILTSAIWSPYPQIVLRQFIQYVGVFLIAFTLTYYAKEQFWEVISWSTFIFMAVMLLSVLMVFINPEIALETEIGIAGSWRGILEQKNVFGILCGIALLCWTAVATRLKLHRRLIFAGFLVIFICLLKTQSSTSLFFGLTSSLIYFVLYRDRTKIPNFMWLSLLSFMLLGIFASILFFFLNGRFPGLGDVLVPFAALFGKTADMTGRDDIWYYMMLAISEHPILGIGYASFWLGVGGPSQFIADALRWSVPSAHNGYLDVFNELGAVGFVFFLLQLLFHLKNILTLFSFERAKGVFHLCLLYCFLVSNFSESMALRPTTFLQFFLFFSMVWVHVEVYRKKVSG